MDNDSTSPIALTVLYYILFSKTVASAYAVGFLTKVCAANLINSIRDNGSVSPITQTFPTFDYSLLLKQSVCSDYVLDEQERRTRKLLVADAKKSRHALCMAPFLYIKA